MRASLGARVLVVDDSATIRAVLGKMLLQDSYEVLKAADGESSVGMAQSQFPDLIFLDIVLPGMSGFAVLRALRRDTRTAKTPIIMMSGNQQATEQFYVQRFGADGFLKKPFGRAEVFHAIRSLVQAGRMPARSDLAREPEIPEGVSSEEWEAIPDVAMPDEAHVAERQASVPDAESSKPTNPLAASSEGGAASAAARAAPTITYTGMMRQPAAAPMPTMRPLLVSMPFVQPVAVRADGKPASGAASDSAPGAGSERH